MKDKTRIHTLLVMTVDLLAIWLSFFITIYLQKNITLYNHIFGYNNSVALLLLSFFFIIIYFLRQHNRRFFRRKPMEEIGCVIRQNFYIFIGWVVYLFCCQRLTGLRRSTFLLFFGLNCILSSTFRLLLKNYLQYHFHKLSYANKLMIITTQAMAESIIQNLKTPDLWSYKLVGITLTDCPKIKKGMSIRGIPVVANKDSMIEYSKQAALDEVFINLPNSDTNRIQEILDFFESMGVITNINIDIFQWETYQRTKQVINMGKYKAVAFAPQIFDFRMQVIKRVMDIIGSIIGLLITGVISIFLIPCLMIESPGKPIFKQTRIGKNGRRFKICKFRSMYMDAEERKQDLMDKNEMNGLMFKMEDDPRVTKVGKFIRKTSIDELPQFWNILKGDMSLVGTRPPTVDEFEQYESSYKRRLSTTPGLTGMWQASGRSDITDFDEVVRLDLEYIDNWSIWLDIKIIFKTFYMVIFGKGAK